MISSYEHLDEFKSKASNMYDSLEIIDIYNFWKEQGYSFTKNFWYGLEEDRRLPIFEINLNNKTDVSHNVEFQALTGNISNDIDINIANSALYKELLMEVYVKKEQSALERSASDYAKKVYDNVKTIIPHLAELLNEKLVGYSEESIMLRPGGNHTRQLCALLNENSKRKICGIIDGSLQCQCKNLGYKIYKTGEPLPKKVKAVILSTYLNADELGEDTKRLYSDLEIIDIYSIWEKQGYHFWKDFWFGTKEDWDV